MQITVKLFAQYRENRFKVSQMNFDSNTTAGDVIELLSLEKDDLPLGVLLLNGKHATRETLLKEGDELALFPKVGGG